MVRPVVFDNARRAPDDIIASLSRRARLVFLGRRSSILIVGPEDYFVQIGAVACLQWFSFNQFEGSCTVRPSFRAQEGHPTGSSGKNGAGQMIQVRNEKHLHISVQ